MEGQAVGRAARRRVFDRFRRTKIQERRQGRRLFQKNRRQRRRVSWRSSAIGRALDGRARLGLPHLLHTSFIAANAEGRSAQLFAVTRRRFDQRDGGIQKCASPKRGIFVPSLGRLG